MATTNPVTMAAAVFIHLFYGAMGIWLLLGIMLNGTGLVVKGNAPIRVRHGETFTISIPSSIGTGYTWQLVDSTHRTHVLLLSKAYKAADNLDGGRGIDQFNFRAIKKGTVQLRFRYVRPWEKNLPKDTQYQIFPITIH